MIALWDIIGRFAGIVRMAMGAAAAALLFWLVVVPLERADARKGYVLEVRALAAEAERDELARQVKAGKIVTEAYHEQLRNFRAKDAADDVELEKRIIENEALRKAAGRACLLGDSDRRFLLDLR